MTDDGLDLGLLAISLSDSELEEGVAATPAEARAGRTALSEEAFQALKSTYRVKVENGEVRLLFSNITRQLTQLVKIWSAVTLPVSPSVNKPEAQGLLHAVEELYFFRRYDEAVQFLQRVFSEEGKGEAYLDEEVQKLLRHYERRCYARLGKTQTALQSQETVLPTEIANSA